MAKPSHTVKQADSKQSASAWPEWLKTTEQQCPDSIKNFWDELPPLYDRLATPIAPAIVFGLLQELKQGYTYKGARTIPF